MIERILNGVHDETTKAIVRGIPDKFFVIDVGGSLFPLGRANAIVDFQPMRTDGDWKYWEEDKRWHTAETWALMDICSGPLPFGDKEVDFLWCTETLEDVRDPLHVCREINRVARSGFITTPSRARESHSSQEGGRYGGQYTGYMHHRWFCELINDVLVFTFKTPITWTVEEFRNEECWNWTLPLAFYWEGGFEFKENFLITDVEIYDDAKNFLEANRRQERY